MSWSAQSLLLALRSPGFLFGCGVWLGGFDAASAIVSSTQGYGVIFLLVVLLRATVRAYVRPGMLRGVAAFRVAGSTAPTSDLIFANANRFWPTLVAQNLSVMIASASFAAGALPGVALMYLGAQREGTLRPVLFIGGGVITLAGSFALGAYGWLGVYFAELVAVFEKERGPASLRRAWALAKGNRRRLLAVALYAAALDAVAMTVGTVALFIGAAVTVPIARLAGDYASVRLFDEIRRERDSKTIALGTSLDRRPALVMTDLAFEGFMNALTPNFRPSRARGASLGEYALVLVAILIAGAVAFKLLGNPTGQSAIEAKRWLEGEGATPTGGGTVGRGGAGGVADNGGAPTTGGAQSNSPTALNAGSSDNGPAGEVAGKDDSLDQKRAEAEAMGLRGTAQGGSGESGASRAFHALNDGAKSAVDTLKALENERHPPMVIKPFDTESPAPENPGKVWTAASIELAKHHKIMGPTIIIAQTGVAAYHAYTGEGTWKEVWQTGLELVTTNSKLHHLVVKGTQPSGNSHLHPHDYSRSHGEHEAHSAGDEHGGSEQTDKAGADTAAVAPVQPKTSSGLPLPPALANPTWEKVVNAKTTADKVQALRAYSDEVNAPYQLGINKDGNCVNAAVTTAEGLSDGAAVVAAPNLSTKGAPNPSEVRDYLQANDQFKNSGKFEDSARKAIRSAVNNEDSPTGVKGPINDGDVSLIMTVGASKQGGKFEDGHVATVTKIGSEYYVIDNQEATKDVPKDKLLTIDQWQKSWRDKHPGGSMFKVIGTTNHIPYRR